MSELHDVTDRADLELLLGAFYRRVLADDVLRPVFVDVMHLDLARHLPVVTGFWERVLFQSGDYRGQAMEVHRGVHRQVPLTAEHFQRWLELWGETLGVHFRGPVADQAQAHARRMAGVFLRNLTEADGGRRALPLAAAQGRTAPEA